MAQIKSEAAYRAALKRIDELLPLTGDDVPEDDPNMLELDMLSDMVEEYEDIHYPIGRPERAQFDTGCCGEAPRYQCIKNERTDARQDGAVLPTFARPLPQTQY